MRPKHEFEPDRFHRWRKYWDYSGGISGDLFVHRVTRIIKSLGLTFPDYGMGAGGRYVFKTPRRSARHDGRSARLSRKALPYNWSAQWRTIARSIICCAGTKRRSSSTQTGFTIVPQKLFQDEVKEVVHTKSGAEDVLLHHRNLHNAIRKNEAAELPGRTRLLRRGRFGDGRSVAPPPRVYEVGQEGAEDR